MPRFNPDHNYRSAAMYRIELRTVDGTPPLTVNHAPTGLGELAIIEVTSLMRELPEIEILRVIIDERTLTITLRVTRNTPDHLSDIIAILDENTARAVRESLLPPEIKAPILRNKHIYDSEFRDRIITSAEEFDRFRVYDEGAPGRTRILEQNGVLLTTPQRLDVDGVEYGCLGNFLLLRNPDRQQVRISRSYTPEMLDKLKKRWRETIRTGGVLVSPFVSAKEKELFSEAADNGGRIIKVVNAAVYGDPTLRMGQTAPVQIRQEEERLLAEHRLLIIYEIDTPENLKGEAPYSRDNCLRMNEVARQLCEEHDSMRVLSPNDRTFR